MAKANSIPIKNGDDKTSVAKPMLRAEEILCSSIEQIFTHLETSPSGLSSEEATERLDVYGTNELAKKKKHTAVVEFLLNFKSPLVIILLIAGTISGILQEYANMVIIFIIVFLSVILDYYQASKAEKAAETLKEKVTTTATVLRDAVKSEVKLCDIVPGDVIYLSAGDIIPADSRVINAKDLFVNQSSLTGESFPVEKASFKIDCKSVSVSEWNNYLFMGTSIVSGTATAVVVRTGGFTEYGKI
ncbi:MAG: HAD-IC family P-type ATPase, partial [Crenarchaeota archaeon]|nr:HAD-IC family P-type ATPase [Thermoproteota archaeon]